MVSRVGCVWMSVWALGDWMSNKAAVLAVEQLLHKWQFAHHFCGMNRKKETEKGKETQLSNVNQTFTYTAKSQLLFLTEMKSKWTSPVWQDYQNSFILLNDNNYYITFFEVKSQNSSLVFSSIAFDLDQTFWLTFHKFLTVLCWNSGPFLLTELV